MPDFDELPYDDVSRAAAAAADEPDFAVIAARGVQRRNRRRASYAGVAAVALIGTMGVVQLAGGDPDSSPDPAPEPLPTGLVFTRADGSTFAPATLTVGCQRVDGTMLVLVSGPFTDPPIDPERSEPTITGNVGLTIPLADIRNGADLAMPDPTGRPAWRLFADDPATDDVWSSRAPASRGVLHVESARCGTTPALVAEVDGVLGTDTGDSTVEVRGALALEAEKAPAALDATAIIDDPDSGLRSLTVSDEDPDTQAALWQQCRSGNDCVERYAVVVTDDGFASRTVVDRVFREEPLIRAAGPVFHLQAGLGPGEFLKPDGSLAGAGFGQVSSPHVVVAIGSGLPLWTAFDGEHLTAMPLPDGASDFGSITVLSDGSLVGLGYDTRPILARSTDLGTTWTRIPLEVGVNALLTVIDGGDGRAVVVEGSDGATLFPFVAVHRQQVAGGPFSKFSPDDDPRAYLSGQAVLPDGRLLVAIEAWSDTGSGPTFNTAPGLFVSAGDDWSTYEEVEVGAPYDALEAFQPAVLATSVSDDEVTVFLAAPPGDPAPAYSSSDGGLTWRAAPGR